MKFSDLFKPEPERVVDESWPQETPEYYEDTSVGTYQMPPVQTDQWAPTADQTIPYRGVEEHGVPFDSSKLYIIPKKQSEESEGDNAEPTDVTIVTETNIDPIPVQVVELPLPLTSAKRMATANFTLTRSGDPIRLAPRRMQRQKLVIAVTGSDTVMVSTDKQLARTQGFLITAGMGTVELDITDDIYGYAPSTLAADPVVYVLEEFTSEADEHTV